ncbi:hypothetical protein ScPMuIL_001413 [Solemya velum]
MKTERSEQCSLADISILLWSVVISVEHTVNSDSPQYIFTGSSLSVVATPGIYMHSSLYYIEYAEDFMMEITASNLPRHLNRIIDDFNSGSISREDFYTEVDQCLTIAKGLQERYKTFGPDFFSPVSTGFYKCAVIASESDTCLALRCNYQGLQLECEEANPEQPMVFYGNFMSRNALLLRTVSARITSGSITDLLLLLEELTSHCEQARALGQHLFCFILSNDVRNYFHHFFHILPVAELKTMIKRLLRLSSRSLYHLKMDTDAIGHCRTILTQLSDYNDWEALETWTMVLFRQGKLSLARDKLINSLKYVESQADEERLKQFLVQIEEEIVKQKSEASSLPDPDWIDNSNIKRLEGQKHRAEKVRQQHVKKPPRHRRKRHNSQTERRQSSESAEIKDSIIYSRLKAPCLNLSSSQILGRQYPEADMGTSDESDDGELPDMHLAVTDCQKQNQWHTCFKMGEAGDSQMGVGRSALKFDTDILVNDDGDYQNESEKKTFFEKSIEAHDEHGQLKQASVHQMIQDGQEFDEQYIEDMKLKYSKDSNFYNSFYNESELQKLLKGDPKRYKHCSLTIRSCHQSIATLIKPEADYTEIQISGRSMCGQSYMDDEVVVEVIATGDTTEPTVNGKVIGRLKRHRYETIDHPVFVCVMDTFDVGTAVNPLCKTVPKIHLHKKTKHENKAVYCVDVYEITTEGKLKHRKTVTLNPAKMKEYIFLVVSLFWNQSSCYPLGAIVDILPCGTRKEIGVNLLALQHCVPRLYSFETIRCIRNEYGPDKLSTSSLKECEPIAVFTIDPPRSKDLDDALSISVNSDGTFEVGVHIADVASVIRLGDAVDKEAERRATTFYTSNNIRPRHMLPECLSENHCSLIPSKCRATLSVICQMNGQGELLESIEVRRSVVRSTKQFTYGEVQKIIDQEQLQCEHGSDIRQLHLLAKSMRQERLKGRCFALPIEYDFHTDDCVLDDLDAHHLIEEFMILANREVAKFLLRTFPKHIPLRCQGPPAEKSSDDWIRNFKNVADVLMTVQNKQMYDHTLCVNNSPDASDNFIIMSDKQNWEAMQQNLKKNRKKEVQKFFFTDDLHSPQSVAHREWVGMQEPAKYVASCNAVKNKQRHYDLELDCYVHFTSPIRRFPDLVIQRLIHAALDKAPSPYTTEEIQSICCNVNAVSARHKAYQKACKFLCLGQQFSKEPKLYDAFVVDVSDSRAKICIPSLSLMLPETCSTLEFNLLGLSAKPEVITDTNEDKDFCTIKWKKRIYHHCGVSMELQRDENPVKRIDPYPNTVFILQKEWKLALETLMKDDVNYRELKKIVNRVNPEFNRDKVRQCTQTVRDVSSEVRKGSIRQHLSLFSLSLTKGQRLTAQIHGDVVKGLLAPRVQILDVTNNVKCCLTHTEDPVKFLSRYSTLGTKDRYDSVDDYLRRWFPLVHMEAATCAVGTEDSALINGVPVKFSGRSGQFVLSDDFCDKRAIEFGTLNIESSRSVDKKEPRVKVATGYLCIRAIRKIKSIWLAHAGLQIVRKEKTEQTVFFDLHPLSAPPPSELLVDNKMECCLEILPIPEVDRRTVAYLGSKEEWKELPEAIALRKEIPRLDKGHSQLGRKIEADVNLQNEYGKPMFPPNNKAQYEAIRKTLASTFSLIQGPPGTGKTYTGIKLIYLFCKINKILEKEGRPKHQVMYCGPSNKSVDLVARTIRMRMGEHCPKIVRAYGKTIELHDYPIPGRTFHSTKSMKSAQADDSLRDVSLHHLIRQTGKKHADEIKRYDAFFKKSPNAVEPDHINMYKRLVTDATIEELKHYDVVFCTTALACNPKIVEGTKVFQCIIDESAMCTEPQTLAPIVATKAKQVVLIGDHKQLQPIIMNTDAAKIGLNISLFERYADISTLLKIQYRMNPQICQFPSKAFYEGKLETGPSRNWTDDSPMVLWPRASNGKHIPHLFCHVEGEEETLTVTTDEGNEQSKSNNKELDLVVRVFNRVVEEISDPNNINVISQYNAQCHKLREKLKGEKYHKVNVNTVVSSQGGEWDYVIFTTVRSLPEYKIEERPTMGWVTQNLGFITDPHQINVALTRARKGIIIIGNANLLKCDRVWQGLIREYEEEGCYVDCSWDNSFPGPLPRDKKRKRYRRNIEQYEQQFLNQRSNEH